MSHYPLQNLSIKQWAEEDRPREKLLTQGSKRMSNAELVAILLGSGNRNESALDLAKRLLASFDNDLHRLAMAGVKEFCTFKGIGNAKAVTLAAALELGQRRVRTDVRQLPSITCSKDAFLIVHPHLADLPHEEFWILLLNRANKLIDSIQISIGGVAGTVVDAKMVFQKALQHLASSIILAHNHPSGNLRPSQADIDLTKKLKQAGQHLDIQVLDHLIITHSAYTSMADEHYI